MADNYERFGEEWEKEMMKFPKKHIIDMLRAQCKRTIELEDSK